MVKIRIIPTILTDGMTVVKGKHFKNSRTVGDVRAVSTLYSKRDIDELMFLDVNARQAGSKISLDLVRNFSEILNIPFSVGGGINSVEDAAEYFRNGAEKIVLGTAAVNNPTLIGEISRRYGSQAVVVSIDIASVVSRKVTSNSGSMVTNWEFGDYVKRITEEGVGEILIQNIEMEGEMLGYDLQLISDLRALTTLPIIASSGCGSSEDAIRAVNAGANALAIGSLFHFTQITPKTLADELKEFGLKLRRV